MKNTLILLIKQAIDTLQDNEILSSDITTDIQLTRPKTQEHGDFSTNIAMLLAKPANKSPRELAQQLIEQIPSHPDVKKIEIAGPGFINFFLSRDSEHEAVVQALSLGDSYGHATIGKDKRIHIEFVSANPTGPLHVGHGRGAAFGACVSNLLDAIGYQVHREYYVNDAGRQMRILAISIWIRYLQLHKLDTRLPQNAYQGQYVIDIANVLKEKYQDRFLHTNEKIQACFPQNIDPENDKEHFIDQLIDNAIALLGFDAFEIIRKAGIDEVLADIKSDLEEFGVRYNEWFPESQLLDNGWLKEGIDLLKQHGHTYEKEGALWFNATKFGDEKDRVLIRKNGQSTYFASDVAYHAYKYEQGYDQIIDVFGADHHGYIARLKAFLQGLGDDPEKLTILLVQFAVLYRGTEKVSMSTRSGEFVTLRELREEVGNDAARFFYIMRKPEQHLDFDLELAKSTSNDNPVYYIQYAHARIASVWRQLAEQKLNWDQTSGLAHLHLLTEPDEKTLITSIAAFPEIILQAATQYAPHKVAHFLQTIAHHFHAYYNSHKFIVEQEHLRNARLCLIAAAQHVFRNGLKILGVSAPNAM